MKQYDIEKIKSLVLDLGWDCQRMSRSGVEIYNEICQLLDIDEVPDDNTFYCDVSERVNYENV